VVIAAVGDRFVGAQPRSADPSLHRPEAVDERQELGDVVAVATGQADRQRDTGGIAQQVVLLSRLCRGQRAKARFAPPLRARMWLPSKTAAD